MIHFFKNNSRYILILLTSILFFGLGIFAEKMILHQNHSLRIRDRLEKKIQDQHEQLKQHLDKIGEKITSDQFSGNLQQEFYYLSDLFSGTNIRIIITTGSKISYWSDNSISFDNDYLKFLDEERVHDLSNGFYLTCSKKIQRYTIIGLILIKDNYSVRNELINNKFAKEYNVPDNYRIQLSHLLPGLPVYDADKEYLFSLIPGGTVLCEQKYLYATSFIYFLGFFFLLLFTKQISMSRRIHYIPRMTLLFVILIAIYSLHVYFRIPKAWYLLELFSPVSYAYSTYLSSLGDLFILVILFFFWCYTLSRELILMSNLSIRRFIALYVLMAFLYMLVNEIILNLIRNSNFSFYLNRMDDISFYSFIGYLIIVILIYSVSIINVRIINAAPVSHIGNKFLRIHVFLFILFSVLSIIIQDSRLYMINLFLLSGMSIVFLKKARIKHTFLSTTLYFIVITTFFSLFIIQNHNIARQHKIQELMAVNLYSETDPAMEVILTEIHQEFVEDTVISELLEPPYVQVQEYIDRKYFSGYPRKYDIQITVCHEEDNLLIDPEDKEVPCFPFFDEEISNYGTMLPNTNFYRMDRMHGRISYLGKFVYQGEDGQKSVFMDFQSRLSPEGAGFPRLLLDQSQTILNRYKHFSYAKYYKNQLVYLSGDYFYDYLVQSYLAENDTIEFSIKRMNHYDHLIYNLGEDSYIIVSTPAFEFLDYLVSFPYLFALFTIFMLCMTVINNPRFRKFTFSQNLKFKIQLVIISAILFSLILVAAGIIYYNSQESVKRHQKNLSEKMESIAEEINIRLYEVDDFTPEINNWLRNELGNLSNIFRADISIYGSDGKLIVSSRPEIFNRGIISRLMNAEAFYQLSENYHLKYMQPEQIGKQKFLSIYEPIFNKHGVNLGFINIPYFSQGEELRQEISTFIVAFINLYLLLFFASVLLAVFLADKITSPLSLIREKLKGIQLYHENEQINYQSNDEIGELVKEYNRKVEELADSAELLAKNEREMAWREMARQVAHEIKNPLTPMKLNIQHLQRAKVEGDSRYDELFDRVTKVLIEQIDTLSRIATEFSNFAQIPTAKSEAFDLVEEIKRVKVLFEGNQNEITIQLNGLQKVFIIADREQISRLLINLVKNAIQSIPENRHGKIEIELTATNHDAIISVKDNGSGISKEVSQRMFQPNFTTKTSGMGLGLAIVRKIADTFKGKIWYETELHKGTIFHVKFPRTKQPQETYKSN